MSDFERLRAIVGLAIASLALSVSGAQSVTAQEQLGTYEDRIAVEDVMARFVWAVDSLDADGYVAVFTEDAVIDSNGSISKGHAEIRKIVTGLIQRRDENKAKGLPAGNLYHVISKGPNAVAALQTLDNCGLVTLAALGTPAAVTVHPREGRADGCIDHLHLTILEAVAGKNVLPVAGADEYQAPERHALLPSGEDLNMSFPDKALWIIERNSSQRSRCSRTSTGTAPIRTTARMIAACNAANVFVEAACLLSAAFSLRDAQRRRPIRSSAAAARCNG
jgi:hypothetical protein